MFITFHIKICISAPKNVHNFEIVNIKHMKMFYICDQYNFMDNTCISNHSP